ncbi:dicarboxylate/amino acid:cation symporter [Serpentinicella sp. ANB-PHB4]|uniref:dicarboxylate/amino acid:cation symporter n=1 Tax=Serpentinicella sp. ANB-PHB4 TaxID=3074076 RepID=UPI002867A724|nr:dicarboxylate/amino acid:cation symporter [Serpentinicella sp. ANB-PHB4]MDR5658847.1 dicarboxylate/amino acid:cation symporter [Serpentinicella sp. ANB-PHB4]
MSRTLEKISPGALRNLTKDLYGLIRKKLYLKILMALFLGIGFGIVFSPEMGLVEEITSTTLGNWLAIPGQIFLGLIQMIVVPLVFASIITGLASSEDMEQLRKLGSRIVIYFIFTTVVAISIGLIVALVIQPGNYIDTNSVDMAVADNPVIENGEDVEALTAGDVPAMLTNLLPQNPLGSMVEKEMLAVVLFSIIIGFALVSMAPDKSKPLIEMLESIQEVCMTVVRWAMLLAPIAVFGLIAQITMKVGIEALLGMAVYVGTVLLGLILLVIFYLLLVTFYIKKSPLWFLGNVRDAQLLAFSTSSSAAVMPLSIETAEDKLGVKSSISQFIIPLGATINMDGTALYQGVATVFLAQVFGIELAISQLLLVIVTAVGASIGSPSTPGVGIVILSMVLDSVGIPAGGIALIIGVDRILDMSRTSANVTGDLTAAMVMNKLLSKDKNTQPLENETV